MKKYNQPMQEQMKGNNFGKAKDHPLAKVLKKHFKKDEMEEEKIAKYMKKGNEEEREEDKKESKQEGMSKDSRKKMAIMVLKKKMK